MGVDNSGFLMIGYDTNKTKIDFSVLGYSDNDDDCEELSDWLWSEQETILPKSLHIFEFGTPPSMSKQNQELFGLYIISRSYGTRKLPNNFSELLELATAWLTEKFGEKPMVLIGNAQH